MKKFLCASALLFSFTSILPALAVAAEARGCGKRGSIEERMVDCARPVDQGGKGDAATRVYSTESGHVFVWRLVTQMPSGNEVWRDDTAFNDKGFLIWADTSESTMNHWLANEYCDHQDRGVDSKGKMKAKYRLPSSEEFRASESHGLRHVLPNLVDRNFWAGDFISEAEALAFEPKDGSLVKTNRGSGLVSARCVFAHKPEGRR